MSSPTGTLRGRLLVATPPLVDANFDRTVVLVLEHTGDGAVGVVLNRPGDQPVDELVPGWAMAVSDPAVVFEGGPVEPDAVIALALARTPSDDPAEGWAPVHGRLGTVDLRREPVDLPGPLDAMRLFGGYAGWGGGQLEDELAAGAWLVVDAAPEDAFRADAAKLWRAVLGRQRGRTAWLANYPDDPGVN